MTQRRGTTPRPSTRVRVLVADDHVDTRELYAKTLSEAGYDVAEAKDGKETVELARALNPVLVVLDLSMPTVDGFEAARLMREDEATKGITILVVTGHAERRYIDRAQALSVDGIMLKPIDGSEVLKRVQLLIARRH
jgi:two-component system, cell cycle response regulator DivK